MFDSIQGIFSPIIAFLLFLVILLLLEVRAEIHNKGFLKNLRHFFKKSKEKDVSLAEYESFIFQLAYSLQRLSQNKVGGLLVIEKKDSLRKFVILGYEMKAKLTSEFLLMVFSNKKSALHDGGVIVRKFDIVSLSSYFPVTQGKMVTELGARHRAAVGLTEVTDSITLVVSETTGKVSYGKNGQLHDIFYEDLNTLAGQLFEILQFYID